jgi:hypothetical protein
VARLRLALRMLFSVKRLLSGPPVWAPEESHVDAGAHRGGNDGERDRGHLVLPAVGDWECHDNK